MNKFSVKQKTKRIGIVVALFAIALVAIFYSPVLAAIDTSDPDSTTITVSLLEVMKK